MTSIGSKVGAGPGGPAPIGGIGPDDVEVLDLDVEGDPELAGPLTRLLAAVVALAIGTAALVNSYLLGLGTATDPGAGLWPAGASGVLVATGLVLLIGHRRVDSSERFGRGTLTITSGVASLTAYVLVFGGVGTWPGLGFELATAALLAFWLRVLGGESWRVTALVSVTVTGALHLFLIELLEAPIPRVIGW